MLKINHLNKFYPGGHMALRDISFNVKNGEFLVIIGLSGSGKSTLLRCINKIIPHSSGEIIFEGVSINHLNEQELRNYRSKIGMIFQQFNLITRFTVLNNVLLGNLSKMSVIKSILGIYSKAEIEKAHKYISIVGLSDFANHRVDKLSGGQKQRVAIARALMQNPKLILADEPVASLDPATSHSVMEYLKKINSEMGVTIVCNLHFLSLVREYATRVIALKNGDLVFDGDPKEIDQKWFKTIYGEDAREVTIN